MKTRRESSRLGGVEARLEETTAQLEAARGRDRIRDRQRDAEWALLSNIGAIADARRHDNADGFSGGRFGRGVNHGPNAAGGDGDGQSGPPATAVDEAKAEEVLEGIRLLLSEWSDRGNALETLTRRLREESERRDMERGRLEKLVQDAQGETGARGEELARMMVEFETRAACAETEMDEKIVKARADAAADANVRVSRAAEEAEQSVKKATANADRKVAEVTSTADQKVAEATATANQKVAEAEEDARVRINLAVQDASDKAEDADRRKNKAQEALVSAKSEEAAAVALSKAAVEGQRGAEAALRVLGRFVGPLHRLCLELREQKRFLARSYRKDKPLQAELFAVAAAVSGKDYWCLLSSGKCSDGGPSDPSNPTRQRHRGGRVSIGNNRGCGDGGNGDEDLQSQGEKQDAAETDSPVQVPPSLRAVVIAVLFANRLTASCREASAAREMFVASGGGGGGVGEARFGRRQGRRQQVGGVGGGRPTDARYMTRAGGLPVLPQGCCGAKGRPLRMPAESELEAMSDAKALLTVLSRLLVFGGCGGGGGRGDGGDDGDDGGSGGGIGDAGLGGGSQGGAVHGGGVMASGDGFDAESGGALNIKALWGGGGARVGDLLSHLLRGRKDHMTRVKERGLALGPRPPCLWSRYTGDASIASPGLQRILASDLGGSSSNGGDGCAEGGGRVCSGAAARGWRVKLGRAVRLELERSVWLGEGPGQPGSLHLRDIRKALAALARELNDSEAKRLEIEHALRSAGGGVGIAELEESADVLRRRVEVLEAEVVEAVVDVDAFAALEENLKSATAVGEGLRVHVDRLEGELATARGEVSEAAVASHRATAHREEAEERVCRLNDSKLELVREVEQLKAFAIRANLEREECLEKERALARERVDETSHASPIRGACRGRNDANPSFFSNQTRATRRAAGEEDGNNNTSNDPMPSPLPARQRQCQWQSEGGPLEENIEWSRQAQAQHQQEHDQTQQRLAQNQEELRRRRIEEERLRARCLQLEARLAEARDRLEEQKGVTGSIRRAAARAHGDAEAARKEARDAETRTSRQESECRRQISLLEARLLETGVRNSRRRDLLQLQACAQEDLAKALTEEAPPTPSTCRETGIGGAWDDGLAQETQGHEEEQGAGSFSLSRSPLQATGRADGTMAP